MHKLKRFWLHLHPHQVATIEKTLSILICFIMLSGHTSAVIRFGDRSLMIDRSEPGVTTNYRVSFSFTTQVPVGSVDMKFCIDPIPYMPCDPPTGLDVSHAVLSSQTGETGFGISTQTSNHLVLSRISPAVVGSAQSTYVFTGVVNPTSMAHSFSIRLSDYASTDATGTPIDVGSVVNMITNDIFLETQVPPILTFCLAQKVSADCTFSEGGNFSDLGNLSPDETLFAQSQMGIGTNASSGFAVAAYGTPMAAGTHIIDPLPVPSPSKKGTNQFGINLVANTDPVVGADPDGPFLNAVTMTDYGIPNRFKYINGDRLAYAPNVSLVRRFTTSYIVNVSPSLPAGVYATTITYICTGLF